MPVNSMKIAYGDSESFKLTLGSENTRCIVVIPAFAEPSLLPTLHSLAQATHSKEDILVIVVINESDEAEIVHSQVNENCFDELAESHLPNLNLEVLYVQNIPAKMAGVGTARKIGMDYAEEFFGELGKDRGIIINLDADCVVSTNYFEEILKYYEDNPEVELVNIHFEHRYEEIADPLNRRAIVDYELHLRYFIEMQRELHLPYAFHTIGSSFAVTVEGYRSVGGMNRRKAGEDFYFIHKFTKRNSASDLNSCTVYPSGRSSFRVPFGTGKAVADLMNNEEEFKTYHPQSFMDLKPLVELDLYEGAILSEEEFRILPDSIRYFLLMLNFPSVLQKLRKNTKSKSTFNKALYQWFDAFRLMKYLHYTRDNYYPNVPISKALNMVANQLNLTASAGPEAHLNRLRNRHMQVFGQFRRYMGHVVSNVGGAIEDFKTYDQEEPVYVPLPKAKQRRAIQFLDNHLFKTPTWLVDADLITRKEASGNLDRIQGIQERTLGLLFNSRRLLRMADQQILHGSEVYTLTELFDDLESVIFEDLSVDGLDNYRRNLHRAYLEQYKNLLHSENQDLQLSDVPLLVRGSLDSIKEKADAASQVLGGINALHAKDLVSRIDKILDPD